MAGIMRRVRSLLGAHSKRVILAAVLAGGAYLVEWAAGSHPQAGSIAAAAGGYWVGYGVRRALGAVTRRGGPVSAGRNGEAARRVLPVPEPEVVILVELGRKIQAIKRYRELNPGTGLKEAKDVIDGLAGQVLSSGGGLA